MPVPGFEPRPDFPHAPAAAYRPMAEILTAICGPDYLSTHPPGKADAIHLLVIGRDRLPTQWIIPRTMRDAILNRMRASQQFLRVEPIPADTVLV